MLVSDDEVRTAQAPMIEATRNLVERPARRRWRAGIIPNRRTETRKNRWLQVGEGR